MGCQTRAETKRLRSLTIREAIHDRGQTEALYLALTLGSLWFLDVRDMLFVLGTCRTFRQDKTLGIMALSNHNMGVHLLHGCTSDWMNVFFQKPHYSKSEGPSFWTKCTAHRPGAHKKQLNGHLMPDKGPLCYAQGQAAQCLSLLGHVQVALHPFYSRAFVATPFGDSCRAHPVLVPLRAFNLEASSAWTMKEAQVALNALNDGLGDDFVASGPESIHVSEVGMHWDHISVLKQDGSASKCLFCDAAKRAIRAYRKEAKTLLDDFACVLKDQQRAWRAQGFDDDERHERRSGLKAAMFPEDSYPDVNGAQSSADDILAHICEHDRFPLCPFPGATWSRERKNEEIFNALASECQELCATLYRPLKQALTRLGVTCGQRLHRSWMDTEEGGSRIRRELLAGISSTGFLVGVYIMTLSA